MYARHRLDVSFADLAYGLARCAVPGSPPLRIPDAIVTLSVRSAWDLLLTSLALPAGSEVVMSAVTHPDMARIARAHGLAVVPVDVDLDTLAPDATQVRSGERTRVLLVAHLFGSEVDLAPLAVVARSRGVLVVEDRAQAFDGDICGDENADVSLFSFGTIKTATALGGAVALVRDAELRRRMVAIERTWPMQPRSAYASKLARMSVLLVATRPRIFGALLGAARLFGRDVERLLSESVRGFPPSDAAFLAAIHRRASAPLRGLLSRRLRNVDRARIARRRDRGEQLALAIERVIRVPGRRARRRTHWLFPVIADDPARLIADLRRAGFDATQRTSGIAAIADDRGDVPPNADRLISRLVFLPAYPELPEPELRRLASVVNGVVGRAADRGPAAATSGAPR